LLCSIKVFVGVTLDKSSRHVTGNQKSMVTEHTLSNNLDARQELAAAAELESLQPELDMVPSKRNNTACMCADATQSHQMQGSFARSASVLCQVDLHVAEHVVTCMA
jgi:hypothetical protein